MNSVYIHIPFCKSICSYCDFCKMVYNEDFSKKYLESLEKETSLYKNEILKTIYIGGGTPSCLKLNDFNRLFDIVSKFRFNKNYEFTVEFNIDDIEEEKLLIAYKNGVNRLSIGIETINEKFFSLINRYNDVNIIKEKIKLCKKYFKNINIDLMYGFPGESIEDLLRDLNFVLELDIQHISIYSLILEKNTKLYIDKVKPISSELESDMYYLIIDYLEKNGYYHYEISNFSKKGFESLHNLNYWNNNEYYGFGLGASGYIDGIRYTNTKSLNNYIKGNYTLDKEVITINKKIEEELICGLRKTKGISKTKFKEKFGVDIRTVFDIDRLIEKNLLKEREDYIFIPKEKLYISNSILVDFIID